MCILVGCVSGAIPTATASAKVCPFDSFASPGAIAGFATVSGDTSCATGEAGEDSEYSPLNSVWFNWTATTSGDVSMTTCGASTFDTAVSVYTGSDLSGLIKVAVVDHSKREPELTRVTVTPLLADAIVEGEVMDPGIVAEARTV